jgi:hypothetical protein
MNDKKTYAYNWNDIDSKLKINLDSFGDVTIYINENEYDLKEIINKLIILLEVKP